MTTRPNKPAERLRDIVVAVDIIDEYVAGCLSFAAFAADGKTIDAVERRLLIIAEAASKLGPAVETLAPDQPWPQIRGLGNRLRHEYDGIDKQVLWSAIRDQLPALRAACLAALEKLGH